MNSLKKISCTSFIVASLYLPFGEIGSVYSAEQKDNQVYTPPKSFSKNPLDSDIQLKNYPSVTHIREKSLTNSGGLFGVLFKLFVPKVNTKGYKSLSNIADNYPKEFEKQYTGESPKNNSKLPLPLPVENPQLKKESQQKQGTYSLSRKRLFFRR
ncbi:hypothetical protein HOE04_00470 [archaeon]|jgi:hypothetical protein|nr:hypothetical protein [archaeon]